MCALGCEGDQRCPGLRLRQPARQSAHSWAVEVQLLPIPIPRQGAAVPCLGGMREDWGAQKSFCSFRQGWDAMGRTGLAGTATAVGWVVVSRCPEETSGASTVCLVPSLGRGEVAEPVGSPWMQKAAWWQKQGCAPGWHSCWAGTRCLGDADVGHGSAPRPLEDGDRDRPGLSSLAGSDTEASPSFPP